MATAKERKLNRDFFVKEIVRDQTLANAYSTMRSKTTAAIHQNHVQQDYDDYKYNGGTKPLSRIIDEHKKKIESQAARVVQTFPQKPVTKTPAKSAPKAAVKKPAAPRKKPAAPAKKGTSK